MMEISSLAKGPTRGLGLKNLRQLQKSPSDFLFGLSQKYPEPVVAFRIGPRLLHLAVSPEAVGHVLVDNHLNYDKQTPGFNAVRELLRNGLLTSEGAVWLKQRRLAQPAFHKERLRHFAALMVQEAEKTLVEWDVGAEKTIDVADSMMRLTLSVAAKSLFSMDLSTEALSIQKALNFAVHEANRRILEVVKLPRFIPTPRNLKAKAAIQSLDEVVHGIIGQRRQEGQTHNDLLSMLMEARDEATGEGMSDEQLRDEVMTLILAGHETTANALMWAWALLAEHPKELSRLRAELEEVLSGRAPTMEDIPRLVYTRRVVDEVLRLFPPAWTFSRRAKNADVICGVFIPANSVVVVSPWVTHHQPSLFENPFEFRPERFEKAPLRYAYFPFGGGPRLCIGNHFALMELTLVLATLLQKVQPVALQPFPQVDASVTLRPAGGLRMSFKPAPSLC